MHTGNTERATHAHLQEEHEALQMCTSCEEHCVQYASAWGNIVYNMPFAPGTLGANMRVGAGNIER